MKDIIIGMLSMYSLALILFLVSLVANKINKKDICRMLLIGSIMFLIVGCFFSGIGFMLMIDEILNATISMVK